MSGQIWKPLKIKYKILSSKIKGTTETLFKISVNKPDAMRFLHAHVVSNISQNQEVFPGFSDY